MRRLLFHHARNLLSSTKDLSSLQSLRLLHVCIIGSGPAGFYTAEKMLKADDKVEIDILDRLPTPFGLVRSGVAPDHPETKIVVNQFTRVATNERCSFYGNVSLGNSVSLPELRQIYDIVVLAYGAESDRSLGVLGEDLRGIYSAREFVWWYNGHPDCYNLEPDLKHTDTAVIFGQGNVALDVARILLRPTIELSATDISSHALAALQKSSIRKVYLVGRRGPAQAACTTKELREILGIKNVNVHIQEADLVKSPADEEGLKNTRIQRRVYELFAKAATSAPHPAVDQRELHFVFFRKPERFLSSDGCNVSGVRLEKTCLKENGGSGRQVAVGTGEFENLNCGLVLKSIGYKSLPVNGLPFDSQRGIVPNVKGRVVSSNQTEHEKVEHGLYVVGWLKRGPTGIIGTNLYCAAETVMSILEDVHKGEYVQSSKPGREGLLHLLKDKNLRFVPFGGWEKIDCKEKMKGQLQNRPRDKITSWEELLKAANE
ncbi:NADPH:adrenodoxin oxidoreductase, mitochondrial isoform X1 [Asparagus officinalis]|uniref:NADPH:adrenodoxin oxidoreductase, mitochondrial isoform X1 n=1 Tax=Asparagus officinalis TaxID=4686 RepID=UPI00098E2EAF|nr:NADPH:adrenodoxin oxidoreductase, mitochondrial isoform X1 [Asparagus officinalis]XP_020276676.1 NADPH:adrenodoxin oxidoreductase, mitochondrial isoform X1 [Asparagus officinalis]XP_020276677.1 NADPH:adrenodoxin oxidoreductase, mitochondrial isoform X1 [Asparagus officinalis]